MKRIAVAVAVAAVVTAPSLVHAEDAFTLERVSASGHLGYGVHLGEGQGNPYGFGLGARGGYTLDMGIYVGGLFDYFFGETEDVAGFSADVNVWILQAEGGYDIGVTDMIVIRPKLGLGITGVSFELCTPACVSDTEARFSLAPGVEAPIDLGPVFVSPEVRFNFVLGDDTTDAHALFFGAGVGAAF